MAKRRNTLQQTIDALFAAKERPQPIVLDVAAVIAKHQDPKAQQEHHRAEYEDYIRGANRYLRAGGKLYRDYWTEPLA